MVKNGKVIGKGYHEKYGEYHAERNALLNLKENPEGADLYVTLEPCSHFGKTPPCVDLIIEKKIGRVIIGTKDPNPLVAGKGIEKLKNAGISVIYGVLEEECLKLNEIFFKYIKTRNAICCIKICNDFRRENCKLYRRCKMGNRRASKKKCT